jgi:hypothetical protein
MQSLLRGDYGPDYRKAMQGVLTTTFSTNLRLVIRSRRYDGDYPSKVLG